MCTVTYLPTSPGFIVTQSRDESIYRPQARFPVRASRDPQLLFPQDPQGGGTWIAVSDQARVLSLMNGAFTDHQRKPPYRKSRGQVVLEAFSYVSAQSFAECYNFSGIEPFTLLWFTQNKIQEVRWNGQKYLLSELRPDQPHVWSSATLYDDNAQSIRNGWFEQWLALEDDLSNTLSFHRQTHNGQPEIAINMQRKGGLQTVSVAKVEIAVNDMVFTYQDLLSEQTFQETLERSDISNVVD
ncbi:MAG: NRDE family protein [Bacteroidota bacterium]